MQWARQTLVHAVCVTGDSGMNTEFWETESNGLFALEGDTSLSFKAVSNLSFALNGGHCIFGGCVLYQHLWKDSLEQRVVSDSKQGAINALLYRSCRNVWNSLRIIFQQALKIHLPLQTLDILLGAFPILIAQYTVPLSQHPCLETHILILLYCGYDYHMNHKWWYDMIATLK